MAKHPLRPEIVKPIVRSIYKFAHRLQAGRLRGEALTESATAIRALTAFSRADNLSLGKEREMKTEVSIEYCVV